MNRLLRVAAPILLALLMHTGKLPLSTAAEELEEQLPPGLEEYARTEGGPAEGIWKLFSEVPKRFLGALRQSMGSGAVLIGVSAASGLLAPLASDERSGNVLKLAVTAALSAAAIKGSGGLLELTRETVGVLCDWSALVLPVMTSAAAAAGSPGAAAVRYGAAALGMALMSNAVRTLILPLCFAHLALSTAAAAFDAKQLKRAAELMKSAVKWGLTLLSCALFAYLVLSGAAAAGVDAVALKTMKTAMGTLPVVGGAASDAASAVLAGAAAVRGTAGLVGLVGCVGLCLGPVLRLAACVTVFRVSALLAASFGGEAAPSLLADLGDSFSMALGSAGLTGLFLFFSIVAMMRGTAP